MSISAAIERGDILEAARLASERLGCIVPPRQPPPVKDRYSGWMDPRRTATSDSTWLCWLKNGVEFAPGQRSGENENRLTVEMHVGFLSLEETPATMNCEDLMVLEYWRRENFEWSRVAELETRFPDHPEYQATAD